MFRFSKIMTSAIEWSVFVKRFYEFQNISQTAQNWNYTAFLCFLTDNNEVMVSNVFYYYFKPYFLFEYVY